MSWLFIKRYVYAEKKLIIMPHLQTMKLYFRKMIVKKCRGKTCHKIGRKCVSIGFVSGGQHVIIKITNAIPMRFLFGLIVYFIIS